MYQQQLCQIVIIHCTRECHSTLFDHVLSEHPVLESVLPDYLENDDGWEHDNLFLAHLLRLWNNTEQSQILSGLSTYHTTKLLLLIKRPEAGIDQKCES